MKNFTEQQELGSVQPSVELKVIGRDEARILGLKRYFTGFSCIHGHFSERLVSTHNCISCSNQRKSAKRLELRKKVKENPDIIHNKNKFIKCNSCKKIKTATINNFHKSRLDRGGDSEICKSCVRIRTQKYMKKPEAKKAAKDRTQKWCTENKDRKNKNSREWKAANKDKVAESSKRYMEKPESKAVRRKAFAVRYWKNPDKYRAKASAYDRRVRNSRPRWQSMSQVNRFYQIAKALRLEVDHIVPVNSELVCGLHCVDNFQLLTRSENARKGNRLWPDMP